MKSIKKIALAALMVAMMAFALCSCGGANADGTYVVFESNGQSIDDALKVYESMGQSLTAEEVCTMKLYDGGKFDMSVMGTNLGSGEYKLSGETLTLSDANNTMDATLKDGVITMEVSGQSMKLKKK